jgi:serine O-acetyltransferase
VTTEPTFRGLVEADLLAYDRRHGVHSAKSLWRRIPPLLVSPYFCPVFLVRLASALATRGRIGAVAGLVISRLNYVVFGLEVARQTEIGPGLYLPHTRGTVIGAGRIGSNVVVYHGVTLGARMIDVGFDPATRPTIGDDVIIGAGAVVVGKVHVGDGARIGPNCVVTADVAPGELLVAPEPIRIERPTTD